MPAMPRHPDILDAGRSRLAVIDMQPRLLSVVPDAEAVTARCGGLVEAAAAMGVPAVATEQNPDKLGGTAEAIAVEDRRAKMAFSAAEALGYGEWAGGLDDRSTDRDQVVLCGIETTVCVCQTALDLAAAGWSVSVAADACGSRRDAALALDRMRAVGVQVVTTDMVLFEWAGRAGTDAFRAVSAIVKRL